MSLSTQGPSRRAVARGAAWAVPALAVAGAAPAFAVSSCSSNCIQPFTGGGATIVNKGLFDSTASLTLAQGLTFVATSCTGLVSGGLVVLTSTTITIRYQNGTTRDFTTSQNLALGGQGGGVFATTDVLVMDGIVMPNGIYASALGLGLEPAVPIRLCATVSYQAIIGGVLTTCSGKVCWDAALKAATVGTLPGIVTFATVWGP